MTNCGPGGSGTESCCTSLEVAGGTYYRTYTSDADGGATSLADPATVSSFRLDKYDVTVGRFRQFVSEWNAGWVPQAGSGKHTHLNGSLGLVNVDDDAGLVYEPGWLPSDDANIAPTNANLQCSIDPRAPAWIPSPGNAETLPINCVNWYEAYAFCIWDGGFLPSEAEWEYAAAGGSQQREYPWGSTDPGNGTEYANYMGGPITPVGSATLGAGLWGQLDLVGNVWQWNVDWAAALSDPCVNCAQITPSSGRVYRGGDYYILFPSALRVSPSGGFNGNEYPPSNRDWVIGFRCARTP
jgi:sulfatase modifying factor 1